MESEHVYSKLALHTEKLKDGSSQLSISIECSEADKGLLQTLALAVCRHRALSSSEAFSASIRTNSQQPESAQNYQSEHLRADDPKYLFGIGGEEAEFIANTYDGITSISSSTKVLGVLPRSLLHEYNLLHRGIGVIVTSSPNDVRTTTTSSSSSPPSIYVHRRTDTKRVFPSLYDMFVGGVSAVSEPFELTTHREVCEELGLCRGMEDGVLSAELFKCLICTSYNRCLVAVFLYHWDGKEQITWQEEEVAWGQFVSHDVVEKAASLSIQRLMDNGKWPGEQPIHGSVDVVEEGEEWMDWDFVPDGLLVWEAWRAWRDAQ